MDKTNQTPQHDTSRTHRLTFTCGEGGVSPIFSSRLCEYFVHLRYISQTSRLEISDSPKISFLKLMCFYALKISRFLTIPTQHLKKNIAIYYSYISALNFVSGF